VWVEDYVIRCGSGMCSFWGSSGIILGSKRVSVRVSEENRVKGKCHS
jgi:hypothetical protein